MITSGSRTRDTDWLPIVVLAGFHAAVVLGFVFFSWEAVIVAVVLKYLTGFAITGVYHRLLSHGSYETYPILRRIGTIIGVCALEGPPMQWVAEHRLHHQQSDQDGDPHSPRRGFWWAHVSWCFHPFADREELYRRYVPDLHGERFMHVMERGFVAIIVVMIALLLGVGYLRGGWRMALSYFAWAGAIRLVAVMHITWAVNSIGHRWGWQRYATGDDSRNNWLLALFTLGEGWHNNHHAKQRQAHHGENWREFDATYCAIWLAEKVGLVWNVRRNVPWRGTVDTAF